MKSYYGVQDNKDANTNQNNAFSALAEVIRNEIRFEDKLQVLQQET